MNSKFLITLLSSSNSKLLKLVYECVLNQKNHTLDYTIIIIVNSLDKSYYNEVCNEFKNIDIEIVETESNGKPGMGHNSLFKVFYEKKEYDYLISLDGDDFLYPYALHQLSKCFNKKNDLDCVCLYGNDTIRDYLSPFDQSDIYLSNHFYLRMGYNIPKTFSSSDSLINPFTYDINKGVQTIIRFIMCSRKFVENNVNTQLYCEKCNVLDDYRFYLNFIDNILNKNMNGLVINSDHIYLYNNINNNSVSKINQSKFNNDYKFIINYLDDFKHLNKIVTNWKLDFIDFYNLTPVFNEELELIDNNNGCYSLNKNNLDIKKNYIYLIDFANNIASKYYKLCINNIEDYLFTNLNKTKAFDLCLFLVNNKIYDRKLFIYTAICYYYTNNVDKTIEFIDKSDYLVNKYKVLSDFYKQYKH